MDDLFAGTAGDYARHRPGYPDAVMERLRTFFNLDGRGRLFDLGCGTGELARRLHADFEAVVGLDVSPDMLAEAERQGAAAGIENIRWVRMAAEDISEELGSFRLCTLGNAFHWMRQDEVLTKLDALLPEGGVVVLGHPDSVWTGDDPWERTVREVLARWLGPRRRTRRGLFVATEGAERRALARSPFTHIEVGEHRWSRVVDVSAIVGELYSTSFASRALLGERAAGFEAELRRALADLDPAGRFVQRLRVQYLLATRP